LSYLLVLSTVPTLQEARKLAHFLLEKRLATCVNITSPVESHYWWKHKKERSKEYLLLIKTVAEKFRKLEKVIRENHSYEVPEIIGIPIQKGSAKYLAWIAKEIKR